MEERPLPQYATLATSWWAVFFAFVLANRRRLPETVPYGDIARVALASYKMSRVVAKEDVTSFVRAPVTEDPDAKTPKRTGMARVLGELVTCPYCLGLWFSGAFFYALTLAPREARFAMSIFSAYAATDFLQAGFVRLKEGPPARGAGA